SKGWQWLSVPVIHRFTQKICEVEINNTVQWGRKHLNALVTNYSKALFFKEYIGFFEQVYAQDWNNLVDINIHIIKYLTKVLGILDKKLVLASELDTREEPTERLIDICRQERGDVYLSGKDGAKYMNTEKFKEEGIKIIFQDYKHPQYTQLYGSFEPYLSIIDLLFNCGPKSLSVLRKGE
ncbi:MAG: WbqC family protein, partial [Candidatus Aminicenantes bacterium]|nr:WbqC family protein [Candidatus Aminicenantes bacterium]